MWDGDLERKREKRRRRFGLIIGLLFALLIHIIFFWGPRFSYEPVMEHAKRVMVVKRYEPVPQPPPPPKVVSETPSKKPKVAPKAGKKKRTRKPTQAAPQKSTTPKQVTQGQQLTPSTGQQSLMAKNTGEGGEGSAEFDTVLKELSLLKGELDAPPKDGWDVAVAEAEGPGVVDTGTGDAGEGEAEGDFLEDRIRVVINTYPPTNIQRYPPPIFYPDEVKVRQANFKEGICRVYYRVKTDKWGKIIGDGQIKTPATTTGQKKFKLFVDAVVNEVRGWKFDEIEADVHVDVYFTIDNE